jgi:hypothetical protein
MLDDQFIAPIADDFEPVSVTLDILDAREGLWVWERARGLRVT